MSTAIHQIIRVLSLALIVASLLTSAVEGLASPARVLGKRGDISSLEDWASQNGVLFADGVKIQQQEDDKDNWQLGGGNPESLEEGSCLVSVPNNLILRSADIVNEFGRDNIAEALQILAQGGFGDQVGEFLVFLKILKEFDQGDDSRWNSWIQCLPRQFTTGVCFDKEELDCLPSFSRTLADFEIKKLSAFSHCADLVRSTWENKQTNSNQRRRTIYDWAFNVVYTRCWKFSDDLESGTTEMVPIGDLFNHKEPATVAVDSNPESNTVDFILQIPMTPDGGLSLSYGLTNPHRFLVIFGFVDESMPAVFSQITFPDPAPELEALGCNDRSKMVYTTGDGGIHSTIWDTVLYALLAAAPEEQMALYEAHMAGDEDTKKALYGKYLLETALTLRNHVDGTLKELEVLAELIEKTTGTHENLPLIKKHNKFLQGVFQRVRGNLVEMVATETMRRRAAAASG